MLFVWIELGAHKSVSDLRKIAGEKSNQTATQSIHQTKTHSQRMGVQLGPPTMVSTIDSIVWQDREIRFDVTPDLLHPRKGEFEIDSIDNIEDTKGNNGEKGVLVLTNLRIIWSCVRKPHLNLSIGYNAIVNITIHTANSRLKGHTQALFVLTKYGSQRFEFIFTNLSKNSPQLFTTVQSVYKSYESTKLYRDLKLRGAIVRDKSITLLPQEQMFNKVGGVWNLSSDQGNLGTFIITNVRVVWFADLAESFNVSIPYLQIVSACNQHYCLFFTFCNACSCMKS